MTNLELIKQCQNGSQMEFVLHKLGHGCLQSTYARKDDKENENKTWRHHCQIIHCDKCHVAFWEQESVYNSLEDMGDSTGYVKDYWRD